MKRARLIAVSVVGLMIAGSAVAFGAAAAPVAVSCSIDANTLTCPLPAQPTVTKTSTRTVTATKTVTATPPATTPPSTTSSATPTTTTATTAVPPVTGYPNADNTGVPAGTALTAYTGPMVITTPNTVIDAKTITGDLQIKTTGVLVKRSKINGDINTDSETPGRSFRIEDSTIDAGPADGSQSYDGTGIGARDFVAVRVHVFNGKRSINCWMNCTIQDSYVHGQAIAGNNEHQSGIRLGAGSTLTHNTIACDAPDTGTEGGCSAAITGYGDFAQVKDVLVQDNQILASTAGFCAYAGSTAGKPYPQADNVRYINNVFNRRTAAMPSQHTPYTCAYYGDIAGWNPEPGSEMTGNVYDDGAPLAYVGR